MKKRSTPAASASPMEGAREPSGTFMESEPMIPRAEEDGHTERAAGQDQAGQEGTRQEQVRQEQAKAKRAGAGANRGISRTSRYIFGPTTRGGEPDVTDPEGLQFVRTPEQGMMWPREYSGAYFLDTLHVATFDDYLARNPERVKPGRRLFFVEKDAGSSHLVFSGTVMPGPTTATSGPAAVTPGAGTIPQGPTAGAAFLGDMRMASLSAPGSAPATLPGTTGSEARPTRAGYDELIEGLRADMRMLRQENTTLMTTNSTLQTKLLEAERLRLAAEAARDAAAERHERELADVRAQHASALDMLKTLHDKDLEVLSIKASDQAQATYAEQLRDMEPEATSFDRVMETLSDLAPVMTPIVTQIGQAVTEYLMDHLEERRVRRRQRRGELSAGGAEGQAATTAGRPETAVPTAGQRRPVTEPEIPMASDANDIFPQ